MTTASTIVTILAIVIGALVLMNAKKKGKVNPTPMKQLGMAILVGIVTLNLIYSVDSTDSIMVLAIIAMGIIVTVTLLIQALLLKNKEQTKS